MSARASLPGPSGGREAKIERIKAIVGEHLGDLGEFSDCQDDASLPSGKAWIDFVRGGDIGALGRALAHTGLRAALIGTGLTVVGARRETLVRDSVAGSLGVDAFILMWSICHR